MSRILQFFQAFSVVLLLASACLANTEFLTLSSSGIATRDNRSLRGYDSRISGQPSLIDVPLSVVDTSTTQFSRSGLLQPHQYEASAIADTTNNLASAVNRELDLGALLDSEKDHPSTWTAADQMILNQALDSTSEHGPWLRSEPQLYTGFGASAEFGSLGLQAYCVHRPPQVPEANTLLLVGGGLIVLAGLLRHRLWGPRAS